MNGGTVTLSSVFTYASVRVEAFKRRQQSRVNVDYAPLPISDEIGAQQPHEAGQAHKIDFPLSKELLEGALKRGAVSTKFCVIDDLYGDASFFCNHQTPGIRSIGNYHGDLCRIVLIFRSLHQSRHIGAASGDEHGDPFATHASPKI